MPYRAIFAIGWPVIRGHQRRTNLLRDERRWTRVTVARLRGSVLVAMAWKQSTEARRGISWDESGDECAPTRTDAIESIQAVRRLEP